MSVRFSVSGYLCALALLGVLGCKPLGSVQAPDRAGSDSFVSCAAGPSFPAGTTFANPLDLNYRFQLAAPSRREAADPTVVTYRDAYYLFASKSGGYWSSDDLIHWNHIANANLPLEDYAPTAAVIDDWLYFIASSASPTLYRTQDPKSGTWEVYGEAFPIGVTDPALFVDDDGRVFLYYGCSNVDPLYGVELDRDEALQPIGTPVPLLAANPAHHGWERPGDHNESSATPWLEGAWMNKVRGRYFVQYAAPGTEFKSYADGVYVSDHPLGPFTYAPNSPFSRKPGGFISGAGHGSTFADRYGNYWHIATMSISIRHKFERRLGLFPARFGEDGTLDAIVGFGDFPLHVPRRITSDPAAYSTGWMLLSHAKPARASSTLPGHGAEHAFDEDVRSHWSANSGHDSEWLSVDLLSEYCVRAIQVNLAEQDSTRLGPDTARAGQYLVESSVDGKNWSPLLDRTASTDDLPHAYAQLERAVEARYVRVTNHRVTSGKFAVSGLRVFGNGSGPKPATVRQLTVERRSADARVATLTWDRVAEATGYNVRYGIAPDVLLHDHIVYGNNSLTLRCLDVGTTYWFAVDAFNENGVTRGTDLVKVE